jgi:hypothetical protein
MTGSKNVLLVVVVSIAAILVGLFIIIYAFELVSIPQAEEYHELRWVIAGLLLIFGGVGSLAYQFLSKPK